MYHNAAFALKSILNHTQQRRLVWVMLLQFWLSLSRKHMVAPLPLLLIFFFFFTSRHEGKLAVKSDFKKQNKTTQ